MCSFGGWNWEEVRNQKPQHDIQNVFLSAGAEAQQWMVTAPMPNAIMISFYTSEPMYFSSTIYVYIFPFLSHSPPLPVLLTQETSKFLISSYFGREDTVVQIKSEAINNPLESCLLTGITG